MGFHRTYTKPADMVSKKQRLFEILAEHARLKMVCPTQSELGRQIGSVGDSVGGMLHLLKVEKKIDWKIVWCGTGIGKIRLVTILETGDCTVKPEPQIRRAAYRPRPSDLYELERAKTVLRRRGRIVFNAEVTDGPASRGLVKVDNLKLPAQDVIAMARGMGAL